jgi:hypothetical protein
MNNENKISCAYIAQIHEGGNKGDTYTLKIRPDYTLSHNGPTQEVIEKYCSPCALNILQKCAGFDPKKNQGITNASLHHGENTAIISQARCNPLKLSSEVPTSATPNQPHTRTIFVNPQLIATENGQTVYKLRQDIVQTKKARELGIDGVISTVEGAKQICTTCPIINFPDLYEELATCTGLQKKGKKSLPATLTIYVQGDEFVEQVFSTLQTQMSCIVASPDPNNLNDRTPSPRNNIIQFPTKE